MLGLIALVLLAVLAFVVGVILLPARHTDLRTHLMTYDEQLRVLRLVRRTRATLEEVLDPLLEPEPDEVRELIAELDEALEAYYKS